MTIQIRVRAKSRFAESSKAYNDQVKHGYNPNYVNPATYRILLDCIKPPSNIVKWEWRVTRQSNGRLYKKSGKNFQGFSGLNVHSTGAYTCQLTLTLRGGKKEKSPVKSINLRDYLIVVIGDSAASGQGNPDEAGKPEGFGDSVSGWGYINPVAWAESAWNSTWDWFWESFPTAARASKASIEMDPKPQWLEKNAYRSLRSGAAIAVRKQENSRLGTTVTFLHFARTGSTIKNGLLGPRSKVNEKWIGNIGQVTEVKKTVRKKTIDALIISIGVNDVGFTGSLKLLVTGDWFSWGDTSNRKREVAKLEGEITKLKDRYAELNKVIQELNVGQVYITEYPTALFDKIKNGRPVASMGCEIFNGPDLSITPRDAQDLKHLAEKLNSTIQAAAKKHGWIYVGGIANKFAGHGYCSGENRLFVKAEESIIIQGDTEGTLHPNKQGHAIIAKELSKALQKGLKKSSGAVTKPVTHKKGEKINRPDSVVVRDHRNKPKTSQKPRPPRSTTTASNVATSRDHRK